MDGVDAALISLEDERVELIGTHEHAIPADTNERLVQALAPDAPARLTWHLDAELGALFAAAALGLLAKLDVSPKQVRAIGSHGQTVYHAPSDAYPCTVQLGDPNVIAERTGVTTVADFRRRDLAARGQGAPLASAFHAGLFRQSGRPRGILNIGGIANLTTLPGNDQASVIGFDTGPGNTLMDIWCRHEYGVNFDADGALAAKGKCIPLLLDGCLDEAFFALKPPKSTGRELFNWEWLEPILSQAKRTIGSLNTYDVQSTLCELTVESVARACETQMANMAELFVCGGGAHNAHLMKRLGERLTPVPVASTSALGIDPNWVEAAAFAWLAHRSLEAKPGNLPSVTGALGPRILGGIYPSG